MCVWKKTLRENREKYLQTTSFEINYKKLRASLSYWVIFHITQTKNNLFINFRSLNKSPPETLLV